MGDREKLIKTIADTLRKELTIDAPPQRVTSSANTRKTRSRPPATVKGQVKILFSIVQNNEEIFYVGGDRASPLKICSLPYNPSVYFNYGGRAYGSIQVTGKGLNDFLVSINYSDPTATAAVNKRGIITISPSMPERNYQLENLPCFLEYSGDGIWSIPISTALLGSWVSTDLVDSNLKWRSANFNGELGFAGSFNGVYSFNIPSAIVYDGVFEWFPGRRTGSTQDLFQSYTYTQKLARNITKETSGSGLVLAPLSRSYQVLLITPGEKQIFYYQEGEYSFIYRVIDGVESIYPSASNMFWAWIIFSGGSRANGLMIVDNTSIYINYQRTGFESLLSWSKPFYDLIRGNDPNRQWSGFAINRLEPSGDTPFVEYIKPKIISIPQATDESFGLHSIAFYPNS